jgi:hydroxyethylthiazole kinase-like uncharacterized protein yjeF
MRGMAVPTLLQRVTPHNGPWALLDAVASRAHELAASTNHAPGALMAAAGLAVAKLALAQWPRARAISVWAGPGNNGGDGLVAARLLHAAGLHVRVHLLADRARLPADAAAALAQAMLAGVNIEDWQEGACKPGDLVIDALLGLGTGRAPQGLIAKAIAAINRSSCPVLAVDLPTGLHPDSGTLLGDEAVCASATLSLLNLKPGCFTGHGRDHAGAAWLCTLGHSSATGPALLSGPAPRPARRHASHKGRYGDVAVVGGAPGMTGAAWLAASAALAAGAGRVYVSLLDTDAVAPPRLELMTRRAWWQSAPAVLTDTTVVAGCGGRHAIAAALPPLLAHAGRLVLDADALNAIAEDAALIGQLQRRRGPTLLTPHPLEAARLLSCSAAEVQADRLGAARHLAGLTQATVLLKGSGTVLARVGATPVINPSGNAALATAGSGDVLAGWCAGLWSAEPDTDALDVAQQAAWQHGDAADRFAALHPHQPMRAAELIEWLAHAG